MILNGRRGQPGLLKVVTLCDHLLGMIGPMAKGKRAKAIIKRRTGRRSIVVATRVEPMILDVRGQKVLLDFSLAEMYGVPTKVLNQAVARNRTRFPGDFMFVLSPDEEQSLKSQIVTSKAPGRGGRRRSRPSAFTEQGVAMLSSVLRSPRAVAVNIEIMRAFVRLRRWLASHADLARRLDGLEAKYDGQFRVVFDAIRALMSEPEGEEPKGPRIGFKTPRHDGVEVRRDVARARRKRPVGV